MNKVDRWSGIKREWTNEDIKRLRGSTNIEHTLASEGAKKLWKLINDKECCVTALGALTGNQAVQQVRAGLEAVYLSGWQVAADANLSGHMYPDQSLYPANSVPTMVKRINQALQRTDQIESVEGNITRDWMVPVVADAEAGFGGHLNAYELMKAMIEAGAAGVHFEDQLSSEKKCGHLGGKVLLPTCQFINTLKAARLAADVMGVSTILIARTDANSAKLITSDIDAYDKPFLKGHLLYRERTSEGFYKIDGGLDMAISRGLAYAPYADMLWCETSTPDIEEARRYAEAIHEKFPGKLLAYNCSPSFNWSKNLDKDSIATFQSELSKMGYKFQFVTLAGFHSLNYSMFTLASDYKRLGMSGYVNLQNDEFDAEERGYTATKHQREVGTGYFDAVKEVITAGKTSTSSMKGSTEDDQF